MQNYTDNTQKKFQAEDFRSLAKEMEEEEEEASSSEKDDQEEQYDFWIWKMFYERDKTRH